MLTTTLTRLRCAIPARHALALVALGVAAFALPSRAEAAPFELAVCAPVTAWPMSSRDRPGFDNAIAEILADELGATVTYTWTNFDEFGIRDTLQSGLCDVAVGISEGVQGILTTVPYLKTPYVFVTRADRDLDIESLDDPRLTEVTIATYQTGIPSVALRNRGITENLVELAAILTPTGLDNHTPIIDAVLNGEVDIGIVYGPIAGARALEEPSLVLRNVTPEVDFGATILQLSRIWTIGVREHDHALRDRLNLTLAARWDDVLAALDAFGVPQWPVARPVDTEADPAVTRVGVIHSGRTPASLENAPVGEDARLGMALAENTVALLETRSTSSFVVLEAHAPTVAAVERAARLLIEVEQVDALIGGYDDAEAHVLARLATEHDTLFVNAGASDDALRDAACFPTTLHVAPSGSQMARGVLRSLEPLADRRLFIVAERETGEASVLATLEAAVAAAAGSVAGSLVLDPGTVVFFPAFASIRESGADTVVLVLDGDAQEQFLAQWGASGVSATIAGLLPVSGQSRPYLYRFLQVAPDLAWPRVVAWDPSLPLEANEAFVSRTAQPLEPAAWTTYAAVRSVYAAASEGGWTATADLVARLTDPSAAWDVGKGVTVRFDASDGQMLQPLYLVEPVPGADWGRTATERIGIARVVGTITPDEGGGRSTVQTASCPRP